MSSSMRGGAETMAEIVLNTVIRGRIARPMGLRRVSSLGCLVASPLFVLPTVVVDPAGKASPTRGCSLTTLASFRPAIRFGLRTLDLA